MESGQNVVSLTNEYVPRYMFQEYVPLVIFKCVRMCAQSEEDYNVEKTRLIQEQRSKLEEQYEKRRLANEMNRKMWDYSG